MADEFTDLHYENYDEESEVFGCNRCSLMMSIIDDRLSSFFSELTNKIKQVEVRLEGLDVLTSKQHWIAWRPQTSRKRVLGVKRRVETLSSSPKAAMSQQMVDSNAACTRTKDKQPVIATLCTVAMDFDAAEELTIPNANVEVKVNKRTPKKKRKETKKNLQKTSETIGQSLSQSKHTAPHEDFPERLLGSQTRRGSEGEGTRQRKQRAPRQRSANDLHQFTETVNTVFKNSQEIRVRKAYRIGSTYCNKNGEQRPRPPKVMLESAEQAQKLIDTNALDFHPTEKQKMRDLRTEVSLRRQKGKKHLTIKDGKIGTTPRPFLWGTAVTITLGGPNPPTLKY